MKSTKLVMFATGFALLGVICAAGYLLFFRPPPATAGLKVITNIPTLVFVDNVQIGTTPIDKLFPPGDVMVKLIPESTSEAIPTFQTSLHLTDKIYSVIQRNFGTSESNTSGSTVSLITTNSNSSGLSVVTSDPDSASVVVDGEPQGFSPLSISSISPTDHRIEISAPGYQPLNISAKSLSGYKLTINAKLAISDNPLPIITLVPTTIPATASGIKTSPGPKLSPVPSGSTTVKISNTPTGFLRVRSAPSITSAEITKINPGETFTLIASQSGWYQISGDFPATTSGWISSQYATKQ